MAVLPVSFAAGALNAAPIVAAPPAAKKSLSPAERLAEALKNPALLVPEKDFMGSVKKMTAYVEARRAVDAAYKVVAADAKKNKKPAPARPLSGAMKTNWYEAYLQELRERAYPNDSLNTDAILKGENQRDRMRPATDVTRETAPADSVNTDGAATFSTNGVAPGKKAERLGDPIQTINLVGGTNWEFVGPKNLGIRQEVYFGPAGSNISGRVNGLAIHPTLPNTVYAAVAASGVWKTTDGGTNWAPIADSALSRSETTCVAIHPTNPSIILVGLGDAHGYLGQGTGRGILRSTDGGTTWSTVSLDSPYADAGAVRAAVSAIVFDPDDPNIVLATSTTYAGYRYRSTNAGQTWTRIPDPQEVADPYNYTEWDSLSVGAKDPANGNRRFYYAGGNQSRSGFTAGLWRSADKGLTWAQVATPAGDFSDFEVAASAVDPNIVYFIRGADNAIYKGVRDPASDAYTWTEIGGTDGTTGGFKDGQNWGQKWYNFAIQCAAQNVNGVLKDALYVSVLSFNGALGTNEANYVPNWVDIGKSYVGGTRTHSDNHCVAVSPSDPTKMVIGNDGGFYPVTYTPVTGGATPTETNWTFTYGKNASIYSTLFYQADFHPTAPNFMLGGLQDNAQPISRGDLNNWANAGGGDGAGAAMDRGNPLRQYALYNNLGVFATADGWATQFNDLTPPFGGGDARPLIGYVGSDPNYPNALYLGSNYLWRYSPLKGAWEKLASQNLTEDTGNAVRVIAVAPSNSQTVYAGTPNGRVWVSFNAGAAWTILSRTGSNGLPNRGVTGIDVNPTNDKEIIVTLSGTGGGHVYRCANTAATTPSFSDQSGTGATGLPDVPFNCIARDYNAPATTWYAGSDIGVFQTTDGGSTWSNATLPLGLPNVSVRTLKSLPGTGYLMAATYGRGIWRIPLQSQLPVNDSPAKVVFPVQVKTDWSLRYGDNSYLFEVPFTVGNIGGTDITNVNVSSLTVTVNNVNWPIQPTSFTTPFVFNNTNTVPKSYGTVIEGAGSVGFRFPIKSPVLTPGVQYPGQLNVRGTYQQNGVTQSFQFTGRLVFLPTF